MSGSQQLLLGGIPTAVPVDPYFYSVTSLLHGDGVNGGQNNTFLDSSSNNFTITRNGNTTQGSFSPFSQTGWSNYFDGSGDYLSLNGGTPLSFGTGDFTIEGWYYFTSTSANLIDFRPSGGNGAYPALYITSGSLRYYVNSADRITSGSTLIANTWYHIAISRSGSSTKMFVNGTQEGSTYSDSTDYTVGTNRPVIGVSAFDVASNFFSGYMSNVRAVKGTAVYTSNFTPSTTPLTAISGTSLLTCQANRFLDASSNNFTITRNGDVSVQPFSPFNPTTAYSTSAVGGSGYFDGSGDYLSVPDAAAFTLGTSDFCMESWVYPTNAGTGASESILGQWSSASYGWIFQYRSNALLMYYSTNGSSTTNAINASATVVNNAWNHIAFVRSGNTLSAYVNGVRVSTNASFTASIVNSSSTVNVGRNGDNSEYVTGYLNSTRLVVGSSVYDPSQSSITVPTAPLTAITNTSLLCNFTNGAIFDNAAVADYETVGNAQISTSVKKYGTGSIAFDGTGDWLLTKATTPFDLGTGNMTFECWFYITNTVADYRMLASDATNGFNYICLRGGGTGGQIEVNVNGTSFRFNLNNTVSQNTWTHLAVVRIGSTWIAYINGLSLGTNTSSGSFNLGNGGMYVGRFGGSPAYEWPGYIDDLRISKGVARYPYNFTPPTAEFPNIGGTVTLTADPYYDYTTLLLPGNGTNGAQNNTFLDSSTNAFSITRNGNTTQGTFSPFSQTGWGNYFDGTGDYLSIADNTALDMGSSDFTIECWVYPVANQGGSSAIFGKKATGGTYGGVLIYFPNTGLTPVVLATVDGSSWGINFTSSISMTLNQWYHLALTRSGSTWTIYVNGTSGGSASLAGTIPDNSAAFTIGAGAANGELMSAACYISNFRVVKGTAVYTANFTPSTTPLTAITNTSLLTCQSNRFIDNSTNNFTITRNGDVSVQAFSPFNPTAAWSAATYGGSGYFDGSGDTLSVAYNAALQLTSSTVFTIEGFVYFNSTGAQQYVLSNWTTGGAGYAIATGVAAFGNTELAFFDGTTWRKIGDVTVGQWYHFAIASSGTSNSAYLYLNGVQTTGAFTVSANISNGSTGLFLMSQNNSSAYTNGYLSTFRVVKGTNVYPSGTTFTPPTTPLTAIANTSLLCNFTNAGIYDATSKNDLETVGNAQISTTQSKFGGSSMYFDGTGDGLIGPSTQLASFGTGDFTIESWVYLTTISGADRYLFTTGNGIDTSLKLYIGSTGEIVIFTSFGTRLSSTNPLVVNTWTHVAVRRYNGTLAVYLNGVQNGTASYSTAIDCTGKISVGSDNNGGSSMIGYLDDFRVTKGIARYTSNFTPPSTAFLTL